MFPKLNSEKYDLPEAIRRKNLDIEGKCKQCIIDIYNEPLFYKGCMEIDCAVKICEYHQIYDMNMIIKVARIIDNYNYQDINKNPKDFFREIYNEIVEDVYKIKL
jgi:hypothetical protein